MEKSMIIVAGGSGSRMGADIPKQFIELNGKPILMHTLENLHRSDASMQLILVLPKEQFSVWNELKEKHAFSVPHELAEGGASRFLSVKSGLSKVGNAKLIGVHDGVRPFVAASVVSECFAAAKQKGAAVPVVPIIQSLRVLSKTESTAVDRNDYRAVQTPQCFQAHVLQNAFSKANRTDYSDDATVVEAFGQQIQLVDGNEENIKITSPIDLELAQLIINGRSE